MDTLFLITLLASFIAIVFFAVKAIIQFVKKDSNKGKKQLKLFGISFVIFFVSFIGFGMTIESTETTTEEEIVTEQKEEKEEVKEEPKEIVQEKVSEPVIKDVQEKVENPIWVTKINELVHNSDGVADKFYALEKFMMDYAVSKEEVEQFGKDIIADYKSGAYLSELENHERMLTNIFKAYIVEQNTYGPIKDFAFDYYQNLKYTYRGVDTVDSAAVRSNERQMNKSLEKM